jgi:exonuclease 3'-5' domain-containing protein 1
VNLYNQFGIQLQNVFDTQAAHVVVEMSEGTGKTESKVKNTSLSGLCQVYEVPYNPFKDKVKSVYRHDQKYWSRRPLTKQMIAYAACDVLILPIIYSKLEGKVKSRNDLFVDLCNENIMCHISADEIKSKRRMRKNNADLMELRAKLDSASPTNLVLSNREMRLLKHLELSAEDKEKLSSSIKVARKLEKLSSKFESSSESNESNPPSLDVTNTAEVAEDCGKLSLGSLDAMVSYFVSSEASTQTVVTMDLLEDLNLPKI